VHRSVSSFSAKKDNTEGDDTMAKPRMDLSAFVGKLLEEQDGDVLREGIRVLSQALMESEVAGLIGAERHERTDDRKAYRNGSRTRTWDTRVGTIELAIPKVTPGTYFPSLLQPRRRAEHALLAVVQEAWVHGISTRKVDDLVKALGIDGISKSEVSRICGELDATITAFRTRPLTSEHRYLWVDATYHKVRVDGRVTSQATVVAVGITSEGERQVLGVDVGPSEDRSFWTAFLRSLVKRGLKGVRLVISDAHEGLKQAIGTVLSGTAWQRCRVHFMRNLLATVPHGAREAVAAIVRTIFAQPDHASALQQLKKIADGLRSRFAKAAALLDEAAEDILAYRHVPLEHQRQLHSTNPLERLNKEIKRRSNVVGIFPNPAAVLRLVGAVLLEQDDEWAVAERRYFSAESMKQLNTPELAATTQEILATIM
jgi:putative transposase